jgi:glycine oxidase
VRGGILVEGDHQIDPAALIISLQAAVEITGVDVRRDLVAEVVIEQGRVAGVRLPNGDLLRSEKVVIAAGAWSGALTGVPEGRLPVRPVKGQLLHLKSHHEPCPISRIVRGLDVYLVPRGDGRLVIGATVEERAWDDTVTAGAVHDLLRYAYELVPGVTEMSFLGPRAGFRPGTPDNAPLLGATDVPGLIAATGHFRNGILLTPVTAEAIAHLLATGETRDEIGPFTPMRFVRSEAV